MKIAIIDKKDITLQIQNNAIKFEEQTIPFRFMDILILNHRATLHTKDILKLTKENISILIISYNNDSFSLTSSANTKNGDIKLAQYNSLDKKIELARYFITQKLISHKEQLEVNGVKNVDITFQLEQLKNATQIDAIMGIEGSFARLYFQEFFNILPREYHKGKRSKKPPQDPVNALMSYWYSLYYNIITVKLLSYGFEPAMGYLHTPFRSHNALSSDILELFRSAINQAVLSVFKHNTLTLEDFTKKGGVYLKYEGRKKVWSEFVELVDTLKPKLDNEIANLKKMINETNNCN
ncbi:CRISPR-associated endonuclease Cas1 [Sulfurimonas hydrogeniphila]|uniref:CRISPR-associated endonuclease Cas1 n=1 Tax=Sulfurimonas hydrogeniphila TaxID=2509341 RepID=UPI00125ED344|nr:CRISPR-associated endonuclease Cas1 [Sulfurimonas hydrogeniphila]